MHPPNKPVLACVPVLTVSVAALVGCSAFANQAASESSTTDSSTPVTSPRTEATASPHPIPSTDQIPPIGDVSLELDDRGDLGTIIVDGSGRTIYAFSADQPTNPTCYDACADTWLPVLAKGDPSGGVGIDARRPRQPRRVATAALKRPTRDTRCTTTRATRTTRTPQGRAWTCSAASGTS